jgi:hypothetical protein
MLWLVKEDIRYHQLVEFPLWQVHRPLLKMTIPNSLPEIQQIVCVLVEQQFAI